MLDLNAINLDEDEIEDLMVIQEVSTKDIAIIGMALNFPKAKNVTDYYNLLASGFDAIGKFPEARKRDVDEYIKFQQMKEEDIKYYEGAFLEDIDKFDYRFFKMTPKEASLMDPNQRLFLQTAWGAIEDAGYGGNRIRGSRTGVYLGYSSVAATGYRQFISNVEPESLSMASAGNTPPIIASRISYLLDLKGPSMLIDTACSASLVSIHAACQSIISGECDMALAGAIKIHLMPLDNDEKLGIEASDHRAKTFDDTSDGTGMGEGVAVILLKPLHKAQEEGDQIYAVIKGSAINQDGSSVGLTAPNASAQEEVIVRAWRNAGIDPTSIEYIEAHGTGTKLGDPIEIEGVTRAFRRYTSKKQFCGIGSVKTNIGHLGNAAGIAGFIKAVLSLKYKQFFPSLHFEKPNRNIYFEDSPVYVNTRLREWRGKEHPRRCGVSSFGISGTNCHIVLEEMPIHNLQENINSQHIPSPYILTLSAKTSTALEGYLHLYIDYLRQQPPIDLLQLTYNANTGREHHPHRRAFLFHSREELLKLLVEALVDGVENENPRVHYESLNREKEPLLELCHQYVNGLEVDWEKIYESQEIRKISLPTYPFEGERCWLDIPKSPRKTIVGEPTLNLLNKIKDTGVLSESIMRELSDLLEDLQGDEAGEKENLGKKILLKGRQEGSYSPMEVKLAEIWGGLLGFKTVNVHDNFYDVGGDSIIALRIVNQLNKEEGLNAGVKELLANPILKDFAKVIERGNSSKENAIYRQLESGEMTQQLEASSSQKRIFTLHNLNPKSLSYNMPAALTIEGKLNINDLKSAFEKMIQRQEALRTTFTLKENTILQVIHRDIDFTLEESQSNLPQEELLKNFVVPFNLETGPLLRATLVTLGDEKFLLMLDLHHIISDGASMGILVKEILQLYQGLDLPTLKLQYRDYSQWQQKILKSEELEEQKEFWLRQFKDGEIPVLNLPTDFQRPPVKNFKGHRIISQIDNDLLKQLRDTANSNNTTLYTILLTAYKILLYRLTGQEDIVVGTPIHGRGHGDLEGIIGIFINTLALRSYPSVNKTFRAYMKEMMELMVEAQGNQLFPFEDLVDALKPPRDMGRNPLFDTMFVLQNMGVEKLESQDLTIKPLELHSQTAKFDLHLSVMEGEEGLRLLFEYDTNLFTTNTINRFIGYYHRILHGIVANIDIPLSNIEMIPPEEKQFLQNINETKREYSKETYFHKTFEEMAKRKPNVTAITFRDESLTYGELNQKANCVASWLIKEGVKGDTIVALFMERSLEMMIGILGILKAGGAYLPISPDNPPKRTAFMLEDSGANIILTQKALISQINFDGRIIPLDDAGENSLFGANPVVNLQHHHLAYVIYTSGSTGNPKGVMIEHAAIINRIHWMQRRYPIGEGDRILQKTPYTFDVSVWELLWWSITGASLCFLEPKGEKDPQKMVEAIEKHKITTLHFVPSMLKIFLEYVELNRCHQKLKSLKQIFASGEALGVNEVEKFRELLHQTNGTRLTNLYGPTEAAVDVSYYDCDFLGEEKLIPIGRPIDNIKLYVVDQENNLQGIGVPGELCIGGVGLARGYLNKPELTSEKFCRNPFEKGSPMYRTGDLVRWLEDGNLEYLGRIDFQVKIRGYRIELGEIEGKLLEHKGIKDVTVIDRQDQMGSKYLVAYIVSKEEVTIQALKEHLRRDLPDYMIPAYFVELEELPLSSNGKIDRKQLPEITTTLETGIEYIAPQNELQGEILKAWQEVLENPKIGIRDDFFSLGGDSFKALRVVNLLQGKITLTDLFQHPTIQQLEDYLSKGGKGKKMLLTKLTSLEAESEETPAVVCIPYGGGNAIIYKPLADALSRGRLQPSLYAVDLPRHDLKEAEAKLGLLPDVANRCVDEIINTIKKPIVLYGHCVGAALTLEIARLLEEQGHPVVAVGLGAVLPVKKPLFGEPKIDLYEDWGDNDIHKFLKSLGGFNESMEEGVLPQLMKGFRQDVVQMRDYFFNYYPQLNLSNKLTTPIYTIVGKDDPLTKGYGRRYKKWQDYGEKVHPPILLQKAGHYFLKTHAEELVEIIEGMIMKND